VHLVGFIIKKFVTMHGHTNVKCSLWYNIHSTHKNSCILWYLDADTCRRFYMCYVYCIM